MTDSKLYQNNYPPNSKWLVFIVLIVITLIFGLSGCLISKKACKEWAATTYKPDTKIVKEYIYIPEIKVDTQLIVRNDTTKETFFIDRERLHIKIERVRDTLRVTGRCDSIIKEVIKEVNVSVSQPCTEDEGQFCFTKWWAWVGIVLIAAGIVLGFALKIKNI
jgi:hypothetical protein